MYAEMLMPDVLRGNEAAQEEWERITPILESEFLLHEVDQAALAAYCLAWQRLVTAQAELDKTALVVRNSAGGASPNPWLKIATDAAKVVREFLARLPFDRQAAVAARVDALLNEQEQKQKGRKRA